MKKIFYLFIAIFFVGCSEDALDTSNYVKSNTANFPGTESDVQMALTSTYSCLNKTVCNPAQSYFMVSELASDDRFGAGGTGDIEVTAISHLLQTSNTMFDDFWKILYQGIFRANTVIETIDNCEWSSDENRNQALGEALFLRAWFNQQLTEMWGEVPLITTTAVVDVPSATAEEMYAQITTDLLQAIDLMMDKPYTSYVSGHATKWDAEGMLARNFLFYTGFYGKETLPTIDGGSVSKADVTAYIENCIASSGHDLVGDFRNLWPYTNELTVNDYNYTSTDNGDGTRTVKNGVDELPLAWAGNGNKESMFSIQFMNYAGWASYPDGTTTYQMGFSNQYILYMGLRCSDNGYESTFPFGQGWGQCTVSTNLWKDWTAAETNADEEDVRKTASIVDCEVELEKYTYVSDCDEDAGYYLKKMQPVTTKHDAEGKPVTFDTKNIFWKYMDGYTASNNGNDMQGAHFQDLMLMRFADILLMHSELTGNPDGINRVRARAGLSEIGYSEEALRNERRWEFAGEGRRWADIRRWGIAETALAKQIGQRVNHTGEWTVMPDLGPGIVARYQATKGFMPIPLSQIELSDYLKQNAGWTESDNKKYDTSMWN